MQNVFNIMSGNWRCLRIQRLLSLLPPVSLTSSLCPLVTLSPLFWLTPKSDSTFSLLFLVFFHLFVPYFPLFVLSISHSVSPLVSLRPPPLGDNGPLSVNPWHSGSSPGVAPITRQGRQDQHTEHNTSEESSPRLPRSNK